MERDPKAVLQAALKGVVDQLPERARDDRPDQVTEFQPARYFTGAQPGYYFGTGARGTGYYLDEAALIARHQQQIEQDGERHAADPEQLLREAEEQAEQEGIQLLDVTSLKRHVAAFERKYKENMEMRMKYADQPEKFMESELDLDEEVQRWLAVAGSPELYPELVKSGVVEKLLQLLSHENTDIVADVLDLFQQLTDADVIEDSEEEAAILVESMIEHNAIEELVHRLTSLAETTDEERKAVFNTLSIFENMIEVKPEVAEWALDRSKLLKWLLGRLRQREFDSNKQYTSELLAILVQNSPKNQQRLADANGIDALLQGIAPYKNRNPTSNDEEEYLENLFNSLCACLISAETRSLFSKAEGVELMLLILKQKRLARSGALKALDFATTKAPANCERFVDQLGIKTIFALFMGKAKLKRRKGQDAEEAEEEERALSVIANIFQGLARGSRRDRMAAKFVENEFEKSDRLIEMFHRYAQRVLAAQAESLNVTGMEEDAQNVTALEENAYLLHQVALIMGHLWFFGDKGLQARLLQLLHQRGYSLLDVRQALADYIDSFGDDGNAVEAEREAVKVRKMMEALGQEESEATARPPLPDDSAQPGVANGDVDVRQAGGEGLESEPPLPPADSPPTRPGDREPGSSKVQDGEGRKERKHKEDRHESKHRHREDREKDRKHRDERDSRREDRSSRKDSHKERRQRDDDHDRRERKRERR